MKKRIIIIVFALMLVLSAKSEVSFAGEVKTKSALEDKVLKMGTNSTFPPYEFIEDGKIIGIDVEIAEEMAKRLGYKLEIKDMEFNTIISSIESGKVNIALAGMTVIEDRLKSVNFSKAYANSVQLIVVKSDSTIKSIDEIQGKKIGTQLGTTGDIFAKDDFGEANVQSFDKHADAILALKSDKIDLVMIDEQTANKFLEHNKDLIALPTPYAKEDYAIAVDKRNPKLLEEINNTLDDMIEDKTIDKIVRKYLKTNEIDSNGKLGIIDEIKRNLIDENLWKYLLTGLGITLLVTFFSLLIGFFLGLILSFIKLAHKDLKPTWKTPNGIMLNLGNKIASAYISFVRGTPTMIQLLVMFNVFLISVNNLVLVAVLTFGFNSAAYMSEIFRGGFAAVNTGELEASRALGLSYSQSFRKVVFPQAMRISLPALGNETITLFKETSIAGTIGLVELTRGANIIISHTFSAFIPYLTAALIYLLFVNILEKVFKKLERSMSNVAY